MDNKRLENISNIRVLAILMVVLGHSIIIYQSSWGLYSSNISSPFLEFLKKIVDVLQMPLFFSVSGYLFRFTHEKKIGFRSLICKKIKRLLIPYSFVWLFWVMPIRFAIGYSGYDYNLNNLCTKFFTVSDVGHLWYLPALFYVFVLSELLLTIIEKILGTEKYSDLFLLMISLGLYLEGYRIGFCYPPLLSAFNYMIWFSCGYIFNCRDSIVQLIFRNNIIKIISGFASIIMLLYLVIYEPDSFMVKLGICFACILTIYGCIPSKTNTYLYSIDKNSFGIYLLHSPLVYITYTYSLFL